MDSHLFDLNATLEGTHWWYTARAQLIRTVAERLVPPSPTVLEVGCGTGGVLAALPRDWKRIGVDPSRKAVDLARSLYSGLDLRVGVAPDDVQEEMRAANLVLICDVLEHVEDDEGLFSSIVETLPLGGQVLLTVPADPTLWTRHDVTHGHYRRYTQETLERLWRTHPSLEIRLLHPFNWRLFPVVRLIRLLSRARDRTLGPGDSDLFLPPRPINAVLHSIFSSEHRRLLARLDQPPFKGGLRGVSWIAALRKTSPGRTPTDPRGPVSS